ncbi:CbiM family transporter [Desulfuribacillus alkaliarsenatis]|uniref:Cobalamin biosynthesis protein CbiM n=1 Tax=Desulfuribacillus alkaliarsenatis TaxID=766136 RepID=A0A1E5G3T6_9FIRM|nr:CbiM family transporter [Desulfuribacillus alkaliarsenatis]OEF97743.1 cobalamin biosynthesis protein CbiM [Desulfuribacillus alkaliarsenatis]
MHISDGVLNLPIAATAAVVSVGVIAYSAKGLKSEEIPKISLLTAAFFVASLIRMPIGPSSVHLLLFGLLGIILGRRAPLAILVGLLMQATLFQHGGIIVLGVNFLMMSIPALVVGFLYQKYNSDKGVFIRSAILGGFAIVIALMFLITALYFSDDMYSHGDFSVINVLVISHIPLIFFEGVMIGIIVKFLYRTRPQLLGG